MENSVSNILELLYRVLGWGYPLTLVLLLFLRLFSYWKAVALRWQSALNLYAGVTSLLMLWEFYLMFRLVVNSQGDNRGVYFALLPYAMLLLTLLIGLLFLWRGRLRISWVLSLLFIIALGWDTWWPWLLRLYSDYLPSSWHLERPRWEKLAFPLLFVVQVLLADAWLSFRRKNNRAGNAK